MRKAVVQRFITGSSWSAYWATRCDTWYKGTEDEIVFAPMLAEVETDDIIYKYSTVLKIHCQVGDKAIGWKDDYLYYSDDNAITFKRGGLFRPVLMWKDIDYIEFAWIFQSGNILIAISNKIFLSTDNLKTFNEIIVRDIAGNPIGLTAPGRYYRIINSQNPVIVNGIEKMMWGNYTNLTYNSEVNIYYTEDDGATITMIYQFGKNPTYGNYGDAGNAKITRHIHSITHNPNNDKWIVFTGDGNNGIDQESHWIEVAKVGANWTFTYLYSGAINARCKTVGGFFDVNNNFYWVGDSGNSAYNGLWKVPYADIGNEGAFVRKLNTPVLAASMIGNNEGEILISNNLLETVGTYFYFSKDFGETNKKIENDILTTLPPIIGMFRMWPKNINGYYLFMVYTETLFGKCNSLFVKIK